jgi:hypothetical protein
VCRSLKGEERARWSAARFLLAKKMEIFTKKRKFLQKTARRNGGGECIAFVGD